jgi:hypothetical protein
MRKRIADAWKALQGNRGSGVLLILIAVFFVTILGATLLYLSYTGHLIHQTSQRSTDNFYDASSVMDEITAGVQNVASDAISAAYTDVLKKYSQLDDPSLTFDDVFRKEMLEKNNLITALGGGTYQYSVEEMYGYVNSEDLPDGATFSVNGYDGTGTRVWGTATANDGIILRQVKVLYTYNGYETTVTADICIDLPDFYKYDNVGQAAGLPDYALVAKEGLTVISGATAVDGNAYAGTIQVTTGSLSLGDDTTTVVAGDVKIGAGTGKMTQAGTSSLWAANMIAGNGAQILLDGKTYLADDLELRKGATVTLKGEYYGFGDSESDPGSSSAILANGTGATLDLTDARRLFLAGVSFIGSESNAASGIAMSESIASKADQRIYLVPQNAINSGEKNPRLMTLPADATQRAAVLDALAGSVTVPADMRSYDVSVVPLAYPVGGEKYVVYLFWSFPTAAQADDFFRNAFESNQTLVSTYVNQYLQVIAQAQSQQTTGYGVSGSGSNLMLTDPYQASLTTQAGRYAGWYKNLRVSLTTTDPAVTTRDNPFDYYVNTDLVSRTSGLNKTGNIGGATYLVTSGDVTINGGNNWDLIITAGNVTVTGDYQGTILCGGEIQVTNGARFTIGTNANLLLGSSEVAQYLRGYTTTDGGNIPDARKTWALDELIHYQNWRKN